MWSIVCCVWECKSVGTCLCVCVWVLYVSKYVWGCESMWTYVNIGRLVRCESVYVFYVCQYMWMFVTMSLNESVVCLCVSMYKSLTVWVHVGMCECIRMYVRVVCLWMCIWECVCIVKVWVCECIFQCASASVVVSDCIRMYIRLSSLPDLWVTGKILA